MLGDHEESYVLLHDKNMKSEKKFLMALNLTGTASKEDFSNK